MIKQLQRFRNIYFYLLVCLCRLMSLFSLLCVCRPRGALTQTVSQLLGGAAYCSFRLLSLSLSLPLCPWGFTSRRQDVCWTAVSEFLLWSGSACLCSSFLRLQHLSLPVCGQSCWNPILSSSVVSTRSISWRYRQTALSHGRKNIKSVYCASQLLNVKVLPFQNRVEEIQLPSLSLSSSRSPPPFSCFFSRFFLSISALTLFSEGVFLSVLSFCILFSADFSIFTSFVCSAFTRHQYNIREIQYNLAGWINGWMDGCVDIDR